MRPLLLLLGAVGLGCSPPPPAAVAVEVACAPEATPLRQRCRVRLTDRHTGRAVEGATVTLAAEMPSMPLLHRVRPVTAAPGPQPGTYQGTLELEMAGRWVVAVRISRPLNDQVTHTLDVGS
ncbi:MAG TPA: FixH family protein [Methylomirabilota bacterium]|jgi:hypothetical protein|nr:FixH family protein [Methylomirabilota bacterium]